MKQISSAEHGASAFKSSRWLRDQAEERIAGHGFARAGFADDAECLAFLDREGNAIDCTHDTGTSVEVCAKIFDVEKRIDGHGRSFNVEH